MKNKIGNGKAEGKRQVHRFLKSDALPHHFKFDCNMLGSPTFTILWKMSVINLYK